MARRVLFAVTGWLVAATLATLIGVGAIQLVGASITGAPGGVRSQTDIERALGIEQQPAPGSVSPAPRPSPDATLTSPASTARPAGNRRSFAIRGGMAVAECTGDAVRMVSWAPAQGYRVEEAEQGPDEDVDVTFDGPGGDSKLEIRCEDDRPVVVPDGD